MNSKGLACVINCTSNFIRLVVAEFDSEGKPRVVDSVINYHSLGRDVFTYGIVRRKALLAALRIFTQYKEFLEGYGITPQESKVIGTSALREARNRDAFIDRIEVRTGFRINVIDGMEENRLMYMMVQHSLAPVIPQIQKYNAMIVEVGGGSTEVMLLRRGLINAIHSVSFGAIRLEEDYKEFIGSSLIDEAAVRQSLNTVKELLDHEMKTSSVRYFIAVGNYARLVAGILGGQESDVYTVVTRDDWEKLAQDSKKMRPEDCVLKWGLPMAAVEGLGNALMACSFLMEDSLVEEIHIPWGGHSEGILMEMGPGIDPAVQERFTSQVRASAISLGKKYHFDQNHAKHVTELALALFDQLSLDHGMGERARLLLEVASLLHDIGTFIKPSGHHKHGMYLVENAEIFGLDPREIKIVANLVRYHRKTSPNPTHINYTVLPREDRLMVLKLASLLRVADALDRSHSQKIRNLKVQRKEDEVRLHTQWEVDPISERFSLSTKGRMFEEIYGLKLTLL